MLVALSWSGLHAAPASGVSVRFATEGTILPRRGHEMLTVESVDLERLDASILHVPESDTLWMLAHPDARLPPETREVWHSQIPVKADQNAPAAGQIVKTPLDVLQIVKPLQPGVYIAVVHEVTTGKPRAEARKLFTISNIGLESFAGADGLAVQARLLSEATPAMNIDIVLIARNNREIARIRSDNDGIVRFGKDQISGLGNDAPAAIYAYGADGEFTALPVTLAPQEAAAPAIASIVTDKHAYKPGETIHGLVLVRTIDGHAATGSSVFAQLENADGGVADLQRSAAGESDGFGLLLHAPPASPAGKWTIRAYRNIDGKPVLLGQTPVVIAIGDQAPSTRTDDVAGVNAITISPGRRSFQRGETANVSIQPQVDMDVTVTLVDTSVHAIVHQRIPKEGVVVQLPIPQDATGGMYVIATGFAPPPASSPDAGKALQRSFGAQWIDIDEGGKRMSVRLDTPERVTIGGKLPVSVTLPDLNGKPGKVQMVGSDAATPAMLDPLAFFYGTRPIRVQITDTYASVIGGAMGPVPDFSARQPQMPSAPALLWPDPATVSKSGKAEFAETFPQMAGADPRLRVSAIAWSDDKLGYGEATVLDEPPLKLLKTGEKKAKPEALSQPRMQAKQIKTGDTLTLKAHDGAIVSSDPIVATPLSYANAKRADVDIAFVSAGMPQFRDYLLGLLTPADDGKLLYDSVLSLGLAGQGLELPRHTTTRMLDAVEGLLSRPGIDADQLMLAHYILLKTGREGSLAVAAWLATDPQPDGPAANAARVALATESPLFAADIDKLHAAIDDQAKGNDLETRALVLTILAQANGPWPTGLAHGVSDEAVKGPALSTRTDLALRLAQAAHLAWGAPKSTIDGEPDKALAFQAGTGSAKLANADNRPLYVWIVTGLPR